MGEPVPQECVRPRVVLTSTRGPEENVPPTSVQQDPGDKRTPARPARSARRRSLCTGLPPRGGIRSVFQKTEPSKQKRRSETESGSKCLQRGRRARAAACCFTPSWLQCRGHPAEAESRVSFQISQGCRGRALGLSPVREVIGSRVAGPRMGSWYGCQPGNRGPTHYAAVPPTSFTFTSSVSSWLTHTFYTKSKM